MNALLQDGKILANQSWVEGTLGDAKLSWREIGTEFKRLDALGQRRGLFRCSFPIGSIGGSTRKRGLRNARKRLGGVRAWNRRRRRAKIGFRWGARRNRRRQDGNARVRLHAGHARKRKHLRDGRKVCRALSVRSRHRIGRIGSAFWNCRG